MARKSSRISAGPKISPANGIPKRTARKLNADKPSLPAKFNLSKPSTSCDPGAVESCDESDPEPVESASKQVKNVKFFAEQCILSNAWSKHKTSDNTLSSLKQKLDFTELHLIVNSTVDSHIKEREDLLKEYRTNFDKWLILMQEGFNIMLYGVGSKISFLEKFVQEKLSNKNAIVVNGFFPGLTIKQILNSITEDILNHQGSFSSLHSHAEFISENLRDDLYLIVHNIDGPALYTERTSAVLCELAKCNAIHYIATVDHVNSGLIWNSTSAACFKFLWFDVTNFTSYRMENAYENSFLLKQSKTLALSSLHHVFCSLTPNAQGIFLLLAKAQLSQQDLKKNGLVFKDLFRRCREEFLVNSELTLQTQLTEFKDHNMVRLRKGQDGHEYLQVDVDPETLKEFLDMQS